VTAAVAVAALPVVTVFVASAALVATVLVHATARAVRRRSIADGSLRSGRGDHHSQLDLLDVVERLSTDVRSGRSPRDALVDALADQPRLLPEIHLALVRRAPLADALAAHEPGTDERDVVVHALRLGAQHPHVLPDVLDRAAAVVRERRTWRHERIVQAAQARTSARVLTFLPLAFAMWGVATSASVRAAYAGSPVTVVVAAVGVGLNTVGWWWMRRVVGGAS
jgi:tight adherence protein B